MDRNIILMKEFNRPSPSLSARRAWIEISRTVGRIYLRWSLSARRAWIEINLMIHHAKKKTVALRKESVDRNYT